MNIFKKVFTASLLSLTLLFPQFAQAELERSVIISFSGLDTFTVIYENSLGIWFPDDFDQDCLNLFPPEDAMWITGIPGVPDVPPLGWGDCDSAFAKSVYGFEVDTIGLGCDASFVVTVFQEELLNLTVADGFFVDYIRDPELPLRTMQNTTITGSQFNCS